MIPRLRRQARYLCIQSVFAKLISNNSYEDLIEDLFVRNIGKEFDREYCIYLLKKTLDNEEFLLNKIEPFLNRNKKNTDYIEMAIILVATSEIFFSKNIPRNVIVNEAIELAKIFGSENSYKYINGVLDKIKCK